MVKMTQPKLYTRGVKLWVRFSLDGQVIKQSLNIEDTKANRKLATTQIIPQMLLKVHSGEFFENTIVPTIKDMIIMSLNIHKGSRKYLTQKHYEAAYRNHIVPHFGNRKLDTIKPSELAIWQNNLLQTHASKTVAVLRVIFYSMLLTWPYQFSPRVTQLSQMVNLAHSKTVSIDHTTNIMLCCF